MATGWSLQPALRGRHALILIFFVSKNLGEVWRGWPLQRIDPGASPGRNHSQAR